MATQDSRRQVSATPAPRPNLTSRSFDDEVVVIDLDHHVIRVFNEVGSRIWQLADGMRTVEQISDLLTLEYDVTYEEAESAVRYFLATLEHKQLVRFSD